MSCDNSGFYLQNKLTNSKETIYDCRFSGAFPKCVTYTGNIASNSTLEVSLLFSDSIGSSKPACLREYQQAKAKAARNAATRREAAYETALNKDANAAWHRGYNTVWTGLGKYELPNVYYRFVTTRPCSQFSTYGCFTLEVVTRKGCSTNLSVELGEYATQGGPKLGTVYGEAGTLDPHVPAYVELDDDQSGVNWGRVASAECF